MSRPAAIAGTVLLALLVSGGFANAADDAVSEPAPAVGTQSTTCGSICPLMSSGCSWWRERILPALRRRDDQRQIVFAQLEHRLGTDAGKVHLMSISIDPEQDTPARLREYARKFHAGLQWQH